VQPRNLSLETGIENLPRAVAVPAAVAAKIEKEKRTRHIFQILNIITMNTKITFS
jgi:hypothetical protein